MLASIRRSSLLLALVLAVPAISHAGKGSSSSSALKPLPAVSVTPNARAVRRSDKRIEKFRRAYLEKAAENGGQPSAKKMAFEQEFAKRASSLGAKLKASADKRPILIIFEGRDGSGKSGTIRRLKAALPEATVTHFGAPDPTYKGPWIDPYLQKVPGEHWMAPYDAMMPAEGEIALWDRSYLGRVVYDPYFRQVDAATTKQRYQDIVMAEAARTGKIRIVKIFVDAGGARLAQTIGKREALAPEKLSDNDYGVFRDRKEIGKAQDKAVKKTDGAVKWNHVNYDERDVGHFEVLKILEKQLL